MKYKIATTVALMALGVSVKADIVVNGNTISWPDNGNYYQVQNQNANYASVCEGTKSCRVPSGRYQVVNHTTGTKTSNVIVPKPESMQGVVSKVTVVGNTIHMPGNGHYYQVQEQNSPYRSVCEGKTSCTVQFGRYQVTNHTTGEKIRDVVVGDSGSNNTVEKYNSKPSPKVNVDGELIWTTNNVPVCWENPTPANETGRRWVREATEFTWEGLGRIDFTNWGPCAENSEGIRVRIADEMKAPHVEVLGSKLDGMKDGMVLNFTFLNWEKGLSCANGGDTVPGFGRAGAIGASTEEEFCIKTIAVHEFGHALGMEHEQNRADKAECDKPSSAPGAWLVTPYDLDSIMNYCNPKWSGDGTLSISDLKGYQTLYGKVVVQEFAPATLAVKNFGSAQSWNSERHSRQLGDVNGDGRVDVVGFGDRGVSVSLANANGSFGNTFRAISNFGIDQNWSVDRHPRLLEDVNGDGRADIVGFGARGVSVSLGNTNGTFESAFQAVNEFGTDQSWRTASHPRMLGDVNGDGRVDIVGFGDDGVQVSLGQTDGRFSQVYMAVNNFGVNQSWSVKSHPRMLGDVNGDGRDDIVGFGQNAVYVSLGQANGLFSAAAETVRNFTIDQSWYESRHPRMLGDVNGDGRTDIVGFGENGVLVSTGRRDGRFNKPILAVGQYGTSQGWSTSSHIRFVTDVNGDGRVDIIAKKGLRRVVSQGLQSGLFSTGVDSEVDLRGNAKFGDVNGDGKNDVVVFGYSGTYLSLAR